MNGVDVIVVGDVMLDVTVDSPALASGGDVHGTVLARPGGGGANAAVWAAAAGARVRFHGRVGCHSSRGHRPLHRARRVSPSRLNASTVTKSAAHGQTTSIGVADRLC